MQRLVDSINLRKPFPTGMRLGIVPIAEEPVVPHHNRLGSDSWSDKLADHFRAAPAPDWQPYRIDPRAMENLR